MSPLPSQINLGQIKEGCCGLIDRRGLARVGVPARLLLRRCWTYRNSRKKRKAVTEAAVQHSRKVKLPSLWITCRKRRRQVLCQDGSLAKVPDVLVTTHRAKGQLQQHLSCARAGHQHGGGATFNPKKKQGSSETEV